MFYNITLIIILNRSSITIACILFLFNFMPPTTCILPITINAFIVLSRFCRLGVYMYERVTTIDQTLAI